MKKTKQFLAYITQNNTKVTITGLMKLSYLIDLVAVKRNNKQITNFEYRRYKIGPFDKKIYQYIEDLIKNDVLIEESEYTQLGLEFSTFKFNENSNYNFKSIEGELGIINDVLAGLKGYTARTLTEIAYKTEPMKKMGATINGNEHFNEIIDLSL